MGRIIALSIAVVMIIGGTGVVLSSASAEVASANISGPWIIASQNGPSPICGFEQAGNNLTGLCIGPKAKGTITGTIIGEQVRWHWQWGTYKGNSAAAFDFIGTLRPDNTITGVVKRPEIGLSINFIAKRQFVAAGAQPTTGNAPPFSQPDAQNAPAPQRGPAPAQNAPTTLGGLGFPYRPSLAGQPPLTKLSPAATNGAFSPALAQQQLSDLSVKLTPPPKPPQETYYEKLVRLYGKDIVERAYLRYPMYSQNDERMEAMVEELRATADRQQGHSYSIHVK